MTIDFNCVEMSDHHLDEVVMIESKTNSSPWPGSTFIAEMSSPTHIVLVATIPKSEVINRETVVGFAGGQLVSDEFHIHSLAVDEKWRRKLVGRGLVEKLIEKAQEQECKSATLEVRVSNAAAISLYEKIGFVKEGLRTKYYSDNGEDAIIMWLRNLDIEGAIKK